MHLQKASEKAVLFIKPLQANRERTKKYKTKKSINLELRSRLEKTKHTEISQIRLFGCNFSK